MKILEPILSDSSSVQKAPSASETKKKIERSRAEGAPSSGDKVELSGVQDQMSAIGSAAKTDPGVRSQKVEEIRQKIQDGSYRPAASQIAEAMVRDALMYSKWGGT